ncbi:MAG: nucleotide sugar dehydrogenase [Actinobacteria bacterium]|nr:MAG: nucleotide sugar dehydrogenase [Actinomycetota bacterium]
MIEELFTKLENWTWSSAVVGLGYVGLPLVVTQARAGVPVTGFDVKESVIDSLNAGRSHIDDIADDELAEIDARFTSDPAKLSEADVIFICVPTPLAVGKLPDISYIERAGEAIAASLRRGQLVILESTTYPGTTEDTLLPILEKSGLKLEDDFLLAYAPERVDPANASFRTANIPRVVGGATLRSTAAAELVYRRFIEKVHPVSSARTAEMAKLLENTFRWVNIALVNEMSTIARAIGVDIWEVVDAAATKPFGFMPFYPGPGVGGHCIPLDPFYLQWAARVTGEGTRFVELAEAINSRMPQVVVSRVQDALNDHAKALRGSNVLVLGVAYKKNVRDFRESPAKETIGGLQQHGAVVTYSDPHVPSLRDEGIELDSVPLDERTLADADCVLILADHDAFDHQLIARTARLVVDTRNALGRRGLRGDNVVTI